MARGINLLTARTVATTTKEGKHADGGGLYLLVRKRGDGIERLWLFRYKRGERGKAREATVSIGPARDVTLAMARSTAARCRGALERGEDPRLAARAPTLDMTTFGAVADELVKDISGGFKSPATRANWKRTLGDRYCASLRVRPIAQVTTEDVLRALKPIWQAKPETARKMRGRIETVLDSAKARGLRQGENPARWRGHLKLLLPAQTAAKGHHRALPAASLPPLMARIRALDSVSALALEWTILTVARTSEAVCAPRAEVDRDRRIWVIPAERMKEGREHRVPLGERCIEIFDALAPFGSKWLFPARDPRKHLSNMAMMECLRGLDVDATVHGFRSTFRDWAGDHTSFPRELAEAALSHLVGDEAERAYRRSDALERRRKMILAWERYCLRQLTESNVVPLSLSG